MVLPDFKNSKGLLFCPGEGQLMGVQLRPTFFRSYFASLPKNIFTRIPKIKISSEELSLGSGGGGSVGRAVASDNVGPRFESCRWQNFIYQLYNQNTEK